MLPNTVSHTVDLLDIDCCMHSVIFVTVLASVYKAAQHYIAVLETSAAVNQPT